MITPIDYGPLNSDMVAMLERMRTSLPVERRLVFAKMLARTVSVDGADQPTKNLGAMIDGMITAWFRERYPGGS